MGLFVEISEAADRDLENIFDYTCSEHGVDQATNYVSSFDEVFQSLTSYPEIGRTRPEIRKGLHSVVTGYHIVFYRILGDRIRIVRILHGARDLPRQFEDPKE